LILTRLGSAEITGRFILALAITAPIILLCNMQLRVIQATDARNYYQFEHYFALRLVTTAAAMLTVLAIASKFGDKRAAALTIILVGVSKGFESLSDVLFGLLQKHERMDRIAASQMLRGGLSLLAMAVLLTLTKSLVVGVIGLAVVAVSVLLGFDARNAGALIGHGGGRVLRPHWERRALLELAKLTLPLGVVSVLISSYATIPRYFLAAHHGEATLGYFAVMASFPAIGATLIEALGQSAIPRLARYYIADRGAYRRLVVRLIAAAVLLGAAAVWVVSRWGAELLGWLFGPDYAAHAAVFPWIMTSGSIVWICSVLGVALTAARYLRAQVLILPAVVAINLSLGWWLIPRYAGYGAAWSLLGGAAVWVLGMGTVLVHAVRRRGAAPGETGSLAAALAVEPGQLTSAVPGLGQ
jgi:O-antigen/teichoic acid export membrane protein